MMTDYAFFLQGSDRLGKDLTLLWGHLNICPSLQQFHISSITQLELSSLTSLKAWGDKEKFHNDITFLLVSAKEEATGDRKYGLSTIWVNPCPGQGPALWRKQLGTDCLGLQWTQLALCLGAAEWGHLPCATP